MNYRKFLFPSILSIFISLTTSLSHIQAQACIDSSLIDPNAICTAIYDPVCGCNGITYSNDCVAQTSAGVTSWTPGPCAACEGLNVDFSDFWVTHSATVQFQDLSAMQNGQIVSWSWSFGDNTTSSIQNPSHTYAAPDQYQVCLTVKAVDNSGAICEKTLCKTVIVPADCFDQCLYEVVVDIDGVSVRGELNPPQPDPPFFFFVQWSLDQGAVTANGPTFFHQVMEPGRHVLCATYPTGDFSPDFCTVCTAFDIDVPCVDSTKIDSVACPLVFIPVCGCNGVTYGNACEAINWGGVTAWTPGPCGSACNQLHLDFEGFNSGGSTTVWTFNDRSLFPGGQISSWYWDFGNGITSNEQNPTVNFGVPGDYVVCLSASGLSADGTQCGSTICQTVHVAETTCIDPNVIDTTIVCPAIYAPVCGCDGNTYENECVAYYHYGVTASTPGICPTVCINPEWIDTTQACIEIYDPVCGCDGQDYENECFAMIHGVRSWKKGFCCDNLLCRALFDWETLPNRTIRLHDLSTNAESWSLSFGDGTQHTGYFDQLEHTYAASGVYQLCLEISNFAGTCTDTYCALINFSASNTSSPTTAATLQLMPNPSAGDLTLQLEGANPEMVIVTDMTGKVLFRQNFTENTLSLSLHHLPPGVYAVQVLTKIGVLTRKIMLQR